MSIVVCQVIALRAARNIGIRVPKTVERAAAYVRRLGGDARDLRRGLGGANGQNEIGTFHYQKDSMQLRSSFPLTAAGVTALHGAGHYSDQAIDDVRALTCAATWSQFNYARWGLLAGGHHYFIGNGHYIRRAGHVHRRRGRRGSYFDERARRAAARIGPSASGPRRRPWPAFVTAWAC
jgi:hypothetical protein